MARYGSVAYRGGLLHPVGEMKLPNTACCPSPHARVCRARMTDERKEVGIQKACSVVQVQPEPDRSSLRTGLAVSVRVPGLAVVWCLCWGWLRACRQRPRQRCRGFGAVALLQALAGQQGEQKSKELERILVEVRWDVRKQLAALWVAFLKAGVCAWFGDAELQASASCP